MCAPVESSPRLWLATITSCSAASSNTASSPPVTTRSDTARSSTAWSSLSSSNSLDRSASVSSRARCSVIRARSDSSSLARPMAMLAWLAAAPRISRSPLPNALLRSRCTTSSPMALCPTCRGSFSSETWPSLAPNFPALARSAGENDSVPARKRPTPSKPNSTRHSPSTTLRQTSVSSCASAMRVLRPSSADRILAGDVSAPVTAFPDRFGSLMASLPPSALLRARAPPPAAAPCRTPPSPLSARRRR